MEPTPETNPLESAPSPLSSRLVSILAIASGLSVANVHYLPPLLAQVAASYQVAPAQASLLFTATQLGFALGLYLLLPWADITEKKGLILRVLTGSIVALSLLYWAPTWGWALGLALLVGLTSIIPQLAIPLGAQLSPPPQRGEVIGKIMVGLLGGILLARLWSGYLGQDGDWRTVYGVSALLMGGLWLLLKRELPRCPPLSKETYANSLASLLPLWRRYPLLRRSAFIGAMIFGAFGAFWSALSFLLEAPPFELSPGYIGLFGLAGLAGALCAPWAGRLSDRRGVHFTLGLNISLILLSYLLLGVSSRSLLGIALGVIILDLGVQGGNVSNLTRVHLLNEAARNRLTALYMIAYFLGGAAGSYLGGWAFQQGGWPGVCALGLGSQLLALGVWSLPLPPQQGEESSP